MKKTKEIDIYLDTPYEKIINNITENKLKYILFLPIGLFLGLVLVFSLWNLLLSTNENWFSCIWEAIKSSYKFILDIISIFGFILSILVLEKMSIRNKLKNKFQKKHDIDLLNNEKEELIIVFTKLSEIASIESEVDKANALQLKEIFLRSLDRISVHRPEIKDFDEVVKLQTFLIRKNNVTDNNFSYMTYLNHIKSVYRAIDRLIYAEKLNNFSKEEG